MSAAVWAWTALGVQLAVFALAFGLRIWVQVRRTGASGFRGISGAPGSPEWWGGVLFGVSVVLGVLAPVLVLTGTTVPVALLAHPPVAVAGVVVAVAGLAIVLAAQGEMGASWRIGVDADERTALVTGGLFGRVRNPIFTGMVAVSAGTALLVPTLPAALAALGMITAVELQVRVVEEPYLRRVHGADYDRYTATAGRFLPGIGRTPAARTARDDRSA